MTTEPTSDRSISLRNQAENLLRLNEADFRDLSSADIRHLIHELRVHQIELELQNEELQYTYLELEKSRDSYSDLYDFAPVAYLTLDKNGRILEANITTTAWLGIERRNLVYRRLSDFVKQEDQDVLYLHLRARFAEAPVPASCEIRLKRADNSFMYVRMHSVLKAEAKDEYQLRLVLTDISSQKRAELILNNYNAEVEQKVEERADELKRAHETFTQMAVTQERQRIAIELHDAVSQSLWSASMIAESLPNLWEKDPQRALEKTQMLTDITRGTLAEMRALLLEIRPEALETTPLSQSLDRLLEAVKSRTELTIELDAEGIDHLSADARIALYRIAQQAIINAERHAQATLIEVNFRCSTQSVSLTVHDNGRGFDIAQPVFGDHHGLLIMHERAESIGAQLSIESALGQGTTVSVRYEEHPHS